MLVYKLDCVDWSCPTYIPVDSVIEIDRDDSGVVLKYVYTNPHSYGYSMEHTQKVTISIVDISNDEYERSKV